MDAETARAEAAFFAATPAQGLSYTVGKLQLMRLLADVRAGEGASFSLASSTTGCGAMATSPSPCSAYERLGDRSELDRARSNRLGPASRRSGA